MEDIHHCILAEKCKLSRLLTYVVSHEEIIGVGGVSSNTKKLDKIVELAVDISAHRHRALYRLHVPLLHKDRPRLLAEDFYLRLRQELTFSEELDLTIQVTVGRHPSPSPAGPIFLWGPDLTG